MSSEVKNPTMPVWKQWAWGLGVPLVIVTLFGAMAWVKNDNDAYQAKLQALINDDPATKFTCTVNGLSEVTASHYRAGTSYTAKVYTDQCGSLTLSSVPTLSDGLHMEVYRELVIGDTYEFSLSEDRIIYKVYGPLKRNNAS